jgi:Serine dehydrogenase proteinase
MDDSKDKSVTSDAKAIDEAVIAQAVPAPSKTPLFQSIHALRYQRQALIQTIERHTKCPLICYVAGIDAGIHRDDVIGFVDLLHNIRPNEDLELLLQTPGGDTDAADKLISMVRTKVGTGRLRIIVPDFAKSAGTLMVLAADTVVMSDTSELGPIDPQIVLTDADGKNPFQHSVLNYLDAFKTHSETLKTDPNNIPAKIMLSKLDPSMLKSFEAAKERARRCAEAQLKQGMFKKGGNWSQTVSELLGEAKQWLSHGQPIYWHDAKDPKIGLDVTYYAPTSPEWQEYWQLYCLQRLAVTDRQKLYESNRVSLVIDSSIA